MFSGWNWFDWVLAAILFFSTLGGLQEGIISGLIGLASLVLGLVAAAAGYHTLAGDLGSLIKDHETAEIVAFLGIFIFVLIVGGVIAAAARKLMKAAGLSCLDRIAGLGFGLLRGFLMDAVLVLALLAFGIATYAVRTSKLRPQVMRTSGEIALMMPAHLREQFEVGVHKLQEGLGVDEHHGESR